MYLKGTLHKEPSRYCTKQETNSRHAALLSGTTSVLQLLSLCLYVQFYNVLFGPLSEKLHV